MGKEGTRVRRICASVGSKLACQHAIEEGCLEVFAWPRLVYWSRSPLSSLTYLASAIELGIGCNHCVAPALRRSHFACLSFSVFLHTIRLFSGLPENFCCRVQLSL